MTPQWDLADALLVLCFFIFMGGVSALLGWMAGFNDDDKWE